MLRARPGIPRPTAPRTVGLWTRRRFRDLAMLLEDHGPESDEALPELVDLAVTARDAGMTSTVVDLLVDPRAPRPVRERAFAHVAMHLDH